ncbi:MAG: helix-turn-helix domain-containing protein [Desulfovibrio sp.]
MTREQRASILGEVIKHAKQGKTQAQIAQCIGVNPSMVYKICKRYGIRTKHMLWKESQKAKKLARPVQCLLPM